MKEIVLALAPHTDDIELACGGTLARLLEEGAEVHCAAFSICEESVPPGFPQDALDGEFRASMRSFGIPDENVNVFRYKVRNFPAQRQELLDELIRLRNRIHPTIVFAPSVHDIHQDHHVIAEEAVRAFKFVKLLGYELGWNNLTFRNQVYYKLRKEHVEQKARALNCYETQKFRKYSNPDVIYALAKVRGVQIACDFAETFELVRWVN